LFGYGYRDESCELCDQSQFWGEKLKDFLFEDQFHLKNIGKGDRNLLTDGFYLNARKPLF
jgi:hypothetical protein